MDVSPLVDGGRFPVSCVLCVHLVVASNAFRDGHDAMGVQAVLTDPQGGEQRLRMTSTNPGLDHWETSVRPETTGHWSFRIEAFSSPYDTWVHTAEVKIPAGLDRSEERRVGTEWRTRWPTESRTKNRNT